MRIYDMKCTHPLCGRVFDWHTKSAIYDMSSRDGFRDVPCWWCGRHGAKRAYTSAPPDLTVKGTWGKHASPELKGKSYYGKQEYERQIAATGRAVVDSGSDRGVLQKRKGPSKTAQRDAARQAIEELLIEQGEMKLKDIIEATGLSDKAVHDVVYRDPGRIQKTGWGVYGITGVSDQTQSSVP